jgi:pyruvate dehydrogenase E1 component alpha subunit
VREKRDPIDHFGQKLIAQGIATEDDLKMIDKDIKAIVVEAADFATTSPEPGVEELYTDILA